METIAEKQSKIFDSLKSQFNYKNRMETPRVVKVVVSTGVGSIKDKGKIEIIPDRLAKITGQKPAPRGAKKSIASFKVREKDVIGYQVTLRGSRMRAFLDKLLNVALPRTRDFKGIPLKAIDEMGNITIGVREHTIFPETNDEELKDVFGMSITLVTNVGNREEAEALLRELGVPLQKRAES